MIGLMIVHTGEALIDFIPVSDSQGNRAFKPVPGGSPYNTAVAAARLEVPNTFLGRISRDFFGDQLVDYLKQNEVDTTMVARDDALSTLAFVSKGSTGEARYAFFAQGAADRKLQIPDIPALHERVRAIQFGSISLIADPVGETIIDMVERERENRVISLDPNIRESLVEDIPAYRRRLDRAVAASTIVKVSDEDLQWMSGSGDVKTGAAALLDRGALLVLVTEGARGAAAFTKDLIVRVAAEKTSVSDTVGAGDSFHAAVLAWFHHTDRLTRDGVASLNESDLQGLLRFAGAVAAKTCGRPGADPPRLSEVATRFRSW